MSTDFMAWRVKEKMRKLIVNVVLIAYITIARVSMSVFVLLLVRDKLRILRIFLTRNLVLLCDVNSSRFLFLIRGINCA